MFWDYKLWNPLNLINQLFIYKFAFKKYKPKSEEYKLMEQMTELWINFAKNGFVHFVY